MSEPDAPLRLHRHAPVLLVPDALSAGFCQQLVRLFDLPLPSYASNGYTTHGFHRETGDFKVTQDGPQGQLLQIVLQDRQYTQVLDRLLARHIEPRIEAAFQARSNSREHWRLARYAAPGGFIGPHRDNNSAATHHRNFTLVIALNGDRQGGDYEGGELRFPEFCDGLYALDRGTAIVWSAAVLHEVRPVTRGQRCVAAVHLSLMRQDGRHRASGPAIPASRPG
jgi:predicted 2-oxoglutarate/Fe(II)-dependent dioxygenase YbiX